jgi:DNA-binding PadR family transcriptional regulator
MLSTLDALLLFLTSHKGQSGYDIRQLFQATPVGMFSDSPGVIYPALTRLEARGLLASAASDGGRRRRVYTLTDAGAQALDAWLGAPVAPEDVARRAADLDLRFVMIFEKLGPAAASAFLTDYAAAIATDLARLAGFVSGPGQAMGRASLAAMDLGARLGQARLAWCRDLLANPGGDPHEPA